MYRHENPTLDRIALVNLPAKVGIQKDFDLKISPTLRSAVRGLTKAVKWTMRKLDEGAKIDKQVSAAKEEIFRKNYCRLNVF